MKCSKEPCLPSQLSKIETCSLSNEEIVLAISNCRGYCVRYKAVDRVNNSHYQAGNKRCAHCMIFIKYFGLRCPCCNGRLRTHPKRRDAARELERVSRHVEDLQQKYDYYANVYSMIVDIIGNHPISKPSIPLDHLQNVSQRSSRAKQKKQGIAMSDW
jgi:hypothetical protein